MPGPRSFTRVISATMDEQHLGSRRAARLDPKCCSSIVAEITRVKERGPGIAVVGLRKSRRRLVAERAVARAGQNLDPAPDVERVRLRVADQQIGMPVAVD